MMKKSIIVLFLVFSMIFVLFSCAQTGGSDVFDVDLESSGSEITADFGGKLFTIIGEEREGRIELRLIMDGKIEKPL